MRHVLVGVGVAVAIAALVFFLWERVPGPTGLGEVERGDTANEVANPRLEGLASPRELETEPTEPTGPASIAGVVTREGKPVRARIEVRKGRYNFGDMASLLLPPYGDGEPILATDAAEDGTFRLAGLDLGSYEVTARGEDDASAWERCFCRPAGPNVTTRLALTAGPAALVGRAVYADGRAFRGFVYARIEGVPHPVSSMPLRQVPTDEAGRFRIEGLPAGEIALTFLDPERFSSSFGGVAVPQTRERVFVVDGDLEAFEGTVVADDTGEPVPDARITYQGSNDDPPRRIVGALTTDASGTFRLRLPVLSGRMWVRADGFAPLQQPLKPGMSLALRIERRGRVVGRVVREAGGDPVAGAAVHAWNWYTFGMKSPLDVTAEDGTFAGAVGPGKGMLYVLDGNWVSATLQQLTSRGLNPTYVEAGQGETTEVVLEVVPAGSVEGTVFDAENDPLPGARVSVGHPRGWSGFRQDFLHRDVLSTTSDAEGRYRVGGLIPGFPYQLRAQPVDGLPATSDPVTAVGGETLEVDLRFSVGRFVEVRVAAEGGTPVGDATVTVSQLGNRVQGVTDAAGWVRIGPLTPEPARLEVYAQGYISPGGPHLGLAGGGTAIDPAAERSGPLVVELTEGFSFAGRILTKDGAPWTESGMLTLQPVGSPAGRSLGLVGGRPLDETGVFRSLGPVPEGAYDIVLVEGRIPTATLVSRWTVRTGAEDLELRVDPAQRDAAQQNRVVIEVVDAEGRKVSGWIRVYTKDGGHWSWRLIDGEYVPVGLEPGTKAWVLLYDTVAPDGEKTGGAWVGPIEVRAGANRIALEPPQSIAGHVRDSAGRPVAGLRIHVESVPPMGAPHVPETFALPAMRTDGAGRFEISGLAPGRHRLLFEAPESFALQVPPVVVAGRTDLDVRLEAGTSFEVEVVEGAGRPVEGAVVKVALPGVADGDRAVTTDAEGRAVLAGLAPDATYDLTVDPPAARHDLTGTWRHGWVPASVQLVLPAGRVVEGVVKQGDAPSPHATVWWRDRRGTWQRERSDGGGRFRFIVLADSEVTLRAGAPTASRVEMAGEAHVLAPDTSQAELKMP